MAPTSQRRNNGPAYEYMDRKQIIFTSLRLLGFESEVMEKQYRIPFNKNMFDLPNKTGFEIVIYFLFKRLNATLCHQQFRDSWPIRDKETEQLFRKTCFNWLGSIAKDVPELHFPRITPSLFMAPGGEKFQQLLFAFTNYILRHVIQSENGVKAGEMLSCPQLERHNAQLAPAMVTVTKAASVAKRRDFFTHSQRLVDVSRQWSLYAADLVKEERRLTKEIKEVEHGLRKQCQHAAMFSEKHDNIRTIRKSGSALCDLETLAVKRAQTVNEVRDLWRKLTALHTSSRDGRSVVAHVLDSRSDKPCINGADIRIQVPDVLLRECQHLLVKKNIENTYEGGKLNLLSLVQLWNLSLLMYRDKLASVGLDGMEPVLPRISTHLHTHVAHLTNAQSLSKTLLQKTVPDLKASIAGLRARVKTAAPCGPPIEHRTPHQQPLLKLLSQHGQKLSLIKATPPTSFSPVQDAADDHHITIFNQPISPKKESTPDAISRLLNSVKRHISHQPTRKSNEDVNSMISTTPTHRPTTDATSLTDYKTLTPPIPHNVAVSTAPRSNYSLRNDKPILCSPIHTLRAYTPEPQPASGSNMPARTRDNHAHAILADKIVNSVMDTSPAPSHQDARSSIDTNVVDPLSALDDSVFLPRDKLERTPQNEPTRSSIRDTLEPVIPTHEPATPSFVASTDTSMDLLRLNTSYSKFEAISGMRDLTNNAPGDGYDGARANSSFVNQIDGKNGESNLNNNHRDTSCISNRSLRDLRFSPRQVTNATRDEDMRDPSPDVEFRDINDHDDAGLRGINENLGHEGWSTGAPGATRDSEIVLDDLRVLTPKSHNKTYSLNNSSQEASSAVVDSARNSNQSLRDTLGRDIPMDVVEQIRRKLETSFSSNVTKNGASGDIKRVSRGERWTIDGAMTVSKCEKENQHLLASGVKNQLVTTEKSRTDENGSILEPEKLPISEIARLEKNMKDLITDNETSLQRLDKLFESLKTTSRGASPMKRDAVVERRSSSQDECLDEIALPDLQYDVEDDSEDDLNLLHERLVTPRKTIPDTKSEDNTSNISLFDQPMYDLSSKHSNDTNVHVPITNLLGSPFVNDFSKRYAINTEQDMKTGDKLKNWSPSLRPYDLSRDAISPTNDDSTINKLPPSLGTYNLSRDAISPTNDDRTINKLPPSLRPYNLSRDAISPTNDDRAINKLPPSLKTYDLSRDAISPTNDDSTINKLPPSPGTYNLSRDAISPTNDDRTINKLPPSLKTYDLSRDAISPTNDDSTINKLPPSLRPYNLSRDAISPTNDDRTINKLPPSLKTYDHSRDAISPTNDDRAINKLPPSLRTYNLSRDAISPTNDDRTINKLPPSAKTYDLSRDAISPTNDDRATNKSVESECDESFSPEANGISFTTSPDEPPLDTVKSSFTDIFARYEQLKKKNIPQSTSVSNVDTSKYSFQLNSPIKATPVIKKEILTSRNYTLAPSPKVSSPAIQKTIDISSLSPMMSPANSLQQTSLRRHFSPSSARFLSSRRYSLELNDDDSHSFLVPSSPTDQS